MRRGARAKGWTVAGAVVLVATVGGCSGGGVDDVQCGPPSGIVQPYESEAKGTVGGTVANGTLCNVGAYLYQSRFTTPPDRVLFTVDDGSASTIALTSPDGANAALLTVMISVAAPSAGEYDSTASTACGQIGLTYDLPIPAGVDCSGGTPPSCSPGCSSECSGFGCEPCTPTQPQALYQAQVSDDCLGNTQTATGSWRLSLTSVDPFAGDAGSDETYYTPHGTLTASLTDIDGGSDTETLSLGF